MDENNNLTESTNDIPKSTNAFAITGFVLSMVSLFFNLLMIPSLLAIIFSGIGVSKSKKLGSGKGLSIAGIIVGIICFIYNLIILLVAIFMIGSITDSIINGNTVTNSMQFWNRI